MLILHIPVIFMEFFLFLEEIAKWGHFYPSASPTLLECFMRSLLGIEKNRISPMGEA